MMCVNKGNSYKKHETGPKSGRWSVWVETAFEGNAKLRKKLKQDINRRSRRNGKLQTRKESFNSDS